VGIPAIIGIVVSIGVNKFVDCGHAKDDGTGPQAKKKKRESQRNG
jgi:hypothetical protein